MQGRPSNYGLGPADVATYLLDLEIRWGVKVSLELRMKALKPGMEALAVYACVPLAIHRRELGFVPEVYRLVGRVSKTEFWSECWALLYDFDVALRGGNSY